jgi:hypothetical protein
MRLIVLALFGGLLLVQPVRAVEPADVNQAIERGVAALRKLQQEDGTWRHAEIGATALAGLTLLECGAAADDKAVQKAALAVRRASPTLIQTYSLSLSILFLDRLDDPADTPLIESMVLRLLEGQTETGGWTYQCPGNPDEEVRRLLATLGGAELKASRELPRLPAKGKRKVTDLSPEIQARLKVLATRGLRSTNIGDNSNTQFATLALWVGRRYGVPVQGALLAIDKRFRSSQMSDGGWNYFHSDLGSTHGSSATMTCSGLLGLAVGHGAQADVARSRDPDAGPRDISGDAQLKLALQALGGAIGQPVGDWKGKGRSLVPAAGGNAYYFLWSLERICVALKLETLGKKDWYAWGAEVLLANQQPDGSWQGAYAPYGADTCFALLFLKKANLTTDLTAWIKGRGDPGLRRLSSGGVGGGALRGADKPLVLVGIGSKEAVTKSGGSSPEKPEEPAPARSRPGQPPDKETRPATGRTEEPDSPANLGRELARASEERRRAVLQQLREGKGVAYTEALADAIPKLEGVGKRQVREVLAERLARMKLETLKSYLRDEDSEIRRGAALACAMKESKPLVPDLIRLLSDPEPTVQHAALAALKDLTRQDFGPGPKADPAERARAIAAWEAWWARQRRE